VLFKKVGRGAHRGEGVFLFDKKEFDEFNRDYDYGKKCGIEVRDLQMQYYLPNLLLLDGHKFDFRVYMLVASVGPLIVYYHDGFLKLSVHKFDRKSTDRGVHLANTEMSKEVFEKAKTEGWLGMNEVELRAFQTWTYERLQNYLLDKKLTTDPNWIENSLRQQMKEQMVHIMRMSQHAILRKATSYELFGCDFMLTEDLQLYFIEANTSPMMEATSPDREKILIKLMKDHFEVMFGLLRSRLKRVINYINNLLIELPSENIFYDSVVVDDYAKRKLEFDAVNKNKMEPEYEISPDNGFQKVIDENLFGMERYAGYIPKECL